MNLYIYENNDGERIVGPSLESASTYHDCELGGATKPHDGWRQVDDDEIITLDQEDDGGIVSKTAKEWAEEAKEWLKSSGEKNTYLSSTYS